MKRYCTACHDSLTVAGHAELQTTESGVETCAVCHGVGAAFDVNVVHTEHVFPSIQPFRGGPGRTPAHSIRHPLL